MNKFYWHLIKVALILYIVNLSFKDDRVFGIILTIVFLIVYSFDIICRVIEAKKSYKYSNLNSFLSTLELSTVNIIMGLFMCFVVTYFISLIGVRFIPVKEIGHFFEPSEYNAKYLIQYKFDKKSQNAKLGTAEIFRESDWNGHSFYYITKIFNDNDTFEFDNSCKVKAFKNWYFCDDLTTNNDTMWIFITDTKIE